MQRKYRNVIIFMFLLIVVSYSCSRLQEGAWDVSDGFESMTYEDVVVSSTDLPLFANIRGYATKSMSDDAQMVTLESLLDRNKSISKTFNQYELTEIPFKSNVEPSYAVLSSYIPDRFTGEYMSRIGLFLVETVDKTENTVDRKVVTVIPDEEYSLRHTGDLSFINKGVFSGTVLYSDIDGSFRDVYVYGGDFCPIINADVIDESERGEYIQSGFLSVVSDVETKSKYDSSNNNVILEPSICIATISNIKNNTFMCVVEDSGYDYDWSATDFSDLNSNLGNGGIYFGGSGGGQDDSAPDLNSPIPERPGASGDPLLIEINTGKILTPVKINLEVVEDVQKYKVSLYTTEGGSVDGSGEYQEGAYAWCRAIPDTSYVFDRWTGDLKSNGVNVLMQVDNDIESTAYFHHLLATGPFRPCYDAERGMFNPLKTMIIAPTGDGITNFVGSTFGKTRNGGKKEHSGLDLYAEPGTPVYAMYDGVISKKQRYVVTQPDRNDKHWPIDYNGDKESAGNRFSIECEVDGQKIYFMYWHMQAGTPVAINPRTGKIFKPGDKVYAGEVVGYTGKTGNAYNVDYKHLHLGVKDENGNYLNPEDFINGKLQWNNVSKTNITNTKIVRIKCDE
ncbi:MAG: M23 family metallopeptidase [Parabacteroides sp.]|nr:M23 family metallopeptidase [Parabacteroides sp.]